MKKLQSLPTRLLSILTIGILFFAISCSDNPASNDDDDHDHADPNGIELVYDGQVIIEYLNGTVTEIEHMHLDAGEEYLFEIHFLDEDGDHIHGEDLDEEFSLGWNIENESVFEIHQHDDDGRWEFHLEAIAEGESRVQFSLLHGSHSDFDTPSVTSDNAIELHVEEDHNE